MIDGKGIFHLLEALSNLRPRLNLSLAFAGDGEDRERMLAEAKARQLDVEYLGRLDREQLIGAYLRSKVLVVPSSTHTEGNPLVIAELHPPENDTPLFFRVEFQGSFQLPELGRLHPLGLGCGSGWMPERGEFLVGQ